MDRQLLHYIWQGQLFSPTFLSTTASEPVRILDTGRRNPGPGPDFLDARICIGDRIRKGHVDMHVLSSERFRQDAAIGKTSGDLALHVVWTDDACLSGQNPVVELRKLVPSCIPRTYADWLSVQRTLPCSDELGSVPQELAYPFLQFMAGERYMQRARKVLQGVRGLGMDWPEAFWRAIARGFGHRANADAFERMAFTLPYRILLRHRSRTEQLEALLLGQSGLLRPDTGDAYARELFALYGGLRKRYKLARSCAPVHFQHARQVNFPTIRLAQLAMLVHRVPELFRMVKDIRDPDIIREMLIVEASAYWDTHYRFGELSVSSIKIVGIPLADHLLVNTVLPFILAYNLHIGSGQQLREALGWLDRTGPLNHSVVHAFGTAGIPARNMSHAQGMLELHDTHCSQLGCAGCPIGKMMLRAIPRQVLRCC